VAQACEHHRNCAFWTLAFFLLLIVAGPLKSVAQSQEKVIFDTDFAIPPQDDGTALMLALKSPELKILGVTTVAGNTTMQQATSDALKVLEVAGRTDIPVYRGFNRPWLHQKTEFATTVHGKWWSDDPPPTPPGGFAKKQAESENAVSFLVRTVNANPHEITIIAIGPLTNVATAIRMDAAFAKNVKKIAIMGGAIATLPDGGGNITPNAEFNFWVDPEAAQVVIRSGIPIVLTPMNVTSKTDFSKVWYDKIVAVDTPLTRFLKATMGPWVAKYPDRHSQMYDQLTVASLVDPSLVKAKDLFVDIDINHGPDYGTSLGAERIWEGGEGAAKVSVQYDVDADRFVQMFVQRITSQ